jgi:hypothetical protein
MGVTSPQQRLAPHVVEKLVVRPTSRDSASRVLRTMRELGASEQQLAHVETLLQEGDEAR